jgi:hypothetical protein
MPRTLVVITAHREGKLLSQAYRNAQTALDRLRGSKTDLTIVLDQPSETTRKAAAELSCPQHEVEFSDVGPARNWAMQRFADDYDFLVFLDGDDYWGGDFLANALEVAVSKSGPFLVSPRWRVQFWESKSRFEVGFKQPSAVGRAIPILHKVARMTNLWGSTFLISSEAAKKLRFRSESKGYGFEDWWFCVDSLEAGFPRYVADGIHYYRQRPNSRRRVQSAVGLRDKSASLRQAPRKPLKQPTLIGPNLRRALGLTVLILQFSLGWRKHIK